MLAVIKTGGKQYLVSPGQKVKVEKLKKPSSVSTSAKATVDKKASEGKEGNEIVFDKVLLVEKNNKVEIGTPFVEGAKVVGKVLREGKAKKLVIFKFKAKKRYRKKKGHRQAFTEVEILKIEI